MLRSEMGLGNVSKSCTGLVGWILLLSAQASFAAELNPDPGEQVGAAWKDLLAANERVDGSAGPQALQKLLTLKEDFGIADLDAFSGALSRAADVRLSLEDPANALVLARGAVQLAPDSVPAHWTAARIRFQAAPGDPSAYFEEILTGLQAGWRDPLYRRVALADLGAGLLAALLATATGVLAMLCLRRWRYFAHDFHHLFPRSIAAWETALLATLLAVLPLIFRVGLIPFFLAVFAATAFYLPARERLVVGALISSLGWLPVVAGILVRITSFSGTPAEDIYRLERGGPESTLAEAQVRKRVDDSRADFPELFALGRLELRRGNLDDAIHHLEQAILKQNNDPRALTNLGNAMFAKGDYEGAADSYRRATQADPTLPAAASNLAKLVSWRARTASSSVATNIEAGAGSIFVNRELLAVPLSEEELSLAASSHDEELKVQNQLRLRLLGDASPPLAWIYPFLLSLIIIGLGFANPVIEACCPCDKCGRPICKRCDPELGMGSLFCNQCVNVFARQSAVSAADKVRKQVEVARYQARLDRTSYLLSLACSGAGHLYLGIPVAGAIYTFLFLFAFFGILFHEGVLRLPYVAERSWYGILPMLAMMIIVHLLSLRGFYKRRAG